MRILIPTLIFITTTLIMYGAAAFLLNEPNPFKWDKDMRGLLSLLFVTVAAVVVCVYKIGQLYQQDER